MKAEKVMWVIKYTNRSYRRGDCRRTKMLKNANLYSYQNTAKWLCVGKEMPVKVLVTIEEI